MATLIVERSFPEPVTDEALDAVMQRLAPCLEEYNVTWKASFVSADRQRMICHFEAADAEAVRATNRAAEAPFDSVWSANVISA